MNKINTLNEIAAYVDLPNGETLQPEDNAFPFVVCYKMQQFDDDYDEYEMPYVNTLLIGKKNSEHHENERFVLIDDECDEEYYMLYCGRIWPEHKVIAFWENPKNNDLHTIIKMFRDQMHITINVNEWLINVICLANTNKMIAKNNRSNFGNNNEEYDNVMVKIRDYYTYPNIKNYNKYKNTNQEDILKWKYAHKYESQKIILNESPDTLIKDDISIPYDAEGAYAFAFITIDNKLYCAIGEDHRTLFYYDKDKLINSDIINAGKNKHTGPRFDIVSLDYYGRDSYEYCGRIWTNENVISFWNLPEPEKLKVFLEILIAKLHNSINVNISLDNYLLELPNKKKSGLATLDNDPYENYEWGDRFSQGSFIRLNDYLNNKITDKYVWDAETLAKQHIDPRMRDKKKSDLFDKGFVGGSKKNSIKYPHSKPEDIMRLKQAMYAESIKIDINNKIFESPDQTCNGLDYDDEDAIPFGFINHNNKIYCIIGDYNDTHNWMCGNEELNPIETEEIEDLRIYRRYSDGTGMHPKKIYDYAGRYWYNSNIISFYVIPEKTELLKYLNILSNKIKRDYKNIRTIDMSTHQHKPIIINFDTLKIEIPKISKRGKIEDCLELLKDYLGDEYVAIKRTPEELAKQHIDPKLRDQKKKDLFDKGFLGGSNINKIKYPHSKPEDIVRMKQAMYAESIQLDSNNRLYENPDQTCNGIVATEPDAIPFGFINYNNKLYCFIGNSQDYHCDLAGNDVIYNSEEEKIIPNAEEYCREVVDGDDYEIPSSDTTDEGLYYLYSGRYWYERNLISFYIMPPKDKLIDIIKILSNKIYRKFIDYDKHDEKYGRNWEDKYSKNPDAIEPEDDLRVSIDINTLKIEIPGDENVPEHLEPLMSFINSDKIAPERSREELTRLHVDPKMRDKKKKDLFDKGFMGGSNINKIKYPKSKPEDIMRMKQAMRAESIQLNTSNKLFEHPDKTCNGLEADDEDAIPFGFIEYNNKLYCFIGNWDDYHFQLAGSGLIFNAEEEKIIPNAEEYCREVIGIDGYDIPEYEERDKGFYFMYSGRYWYERNTISFYIMPPKDKLVNIIKILSNKIYRKYIDFDKHEEKYGRNWKDKYSKNIDAMEPEDDLRVSIDINTLKIEIPGDENVPEHLEPLMSFINSDKQAPERSREELTRLHTDPRMRDKKKKDLFDKGFMGGSRKDQLRFPGSKPEDIMRLKQAMRAESIQLDSINRLYENPDTTFITDKDNNEKRLNATNINTYPFLLGNSNMDESGPLDVLAWGDERSYHESSNEEVVRLFEGETGVPIVKGRVWVDYKVIATWTNPQPKDFEVMCKFISSKIGQNVLGDGWQMCIYVYKDDKDLLVQKDLRRDEFEFDKRGKMELIIPTNCYRGYPGSMKNQGHNVEYDRYKKKFPNSEIRPEDIMRLKQAKIRSESSESFESLNREYKNILNEAELRGEPLTPTELRKLLHQKVLNFEFIKKNGEHRKAKGTTVMKKIPDVDKPKGGKSSPTVVPFYDLKKHDWRSVSTESPEIVQSPSFLGNLKDKIKDIFKRPEIKVEPTEIDKTELNIPDIDTTDINKIETLPTDELPIEEPSIEPTGDEYTDDTLGITPIRHEDILPDENIIPDLPFHAAKIVPSDSILNIPEKPIISKINVYDDKPTSPIKHYINNLRGMDSEDKYNAQKVNTQYITPDSVPQIKTLYNTTPEEEITNLERNLPGIDNPANLPKLDLNVPNTVNPVSIPNNTINNEQPKLNIDSSIKI